MSGCAVCVHDLYQESLEAYDASIASIRASLIVLNIPEAEWPAQIQTAAAGKERKKDVALSAFEQMELELSAKQEARAKSVVDVDIR